ncbi:Helicase required for RNAi-mediated heterochromatin assembly 1 [Golovinomyces cichoracearum]|uniref:Helicase required for RNAi-mediated heterochromatin assembly 1 n=1 Tax=Golovinomyces cichoracearum TaxID=62708 RepID=A0A420HGK0_9PEZI|nr:Helicase required for RNAi-mediated heterochromatin assembly 1 [Golovinomyces cichoracearum]
MHPEAGSKRGGAFLTSTDETDIDVPNNFSHFNAALHKAREILIEHYHVKKQIPELPPEETWRNLPHIPNSEEIMGYENPLKISTEPEKWNEYQNDPVYDPKIPFNIVDRPWPSTNEYISAHYRILREDAIASLRKSVQTFKCNPKMMEDSTTYIYTEVTLTGWMFTKKGPVCRVEFCVDRSETRVRWDQSKRLSQGTIVALSSSQKLFNGDCRVAVVAGRPIEGGLDQNPPTIDLFLGDGDQVWLDPHEKYVMIEAREGYFEASRYMLIAMQKLMIERFPLQKYLVFLESKVEPPQYLVDQPRLNITSLVNSEGDDSVEAKQKQETINELRSIDVLHDFPKNLASGMDESQIQALKSILTESVAIVQGPPGTGKTYVSVSSLRIMIENLGPNDPPIIVAAQTNHALDQLLNHIIKFEPNIVRLGGQSARTNKEIRKRTLFELHQANYLQSMSRGLSRCQREFKKLIVNLKTILAPLLTASLLNPEQLVTYKIITEDLRKTFSAANWADDETTDNELVSWLGKDQIVPIERASPINLGLPLEEDSSEYDQKKVNLDLDEDPDLNDPMDVNIGELIGEWVPYLRKFTGNHVGVIDSRKWKKRMSKIKDIYEIHENERGTAYRYFEMRTNSCILKSFKAALKEYEELIYEFQISRGLQDFELIRNLGIKVIGCTTSGLAKYRGLLSALLPRTLLIEEAAETLEGKVMAGIPESIQQIIMVGDHQQLQASCTVRPLQEAPYHMRISMFERMIRNKFPYIMLNKQRRMITDVRELLCIKKNPFYRNLHDHEIVLDRIHARPHIPGMGGKDTYFFNHNWPEARNIDGSCYNEDEAEMVVAFFYYLHLNGVEPSKITILTFYRGQKNLILSILKNHASLAHVDYFNVHTVDGYQGEENDVILLSLVRSNMPRSIGFLDNKNRLVVALSRARRGLYIFGNSVTLITGESSDTNCGREPLWLPLILHMASKFRYDLDKGLPLTCERHKKVTFVRDAEDLAKLAGGCDLKCDRGLLPCNHKCPLTCHIFDHESVTCCQEPCKKILICGHTCSGNCGAKCTCNECNLRDDGADELEALETELRDQRNNLLKEDPSEPKNMAFKNFSATDSIISSQQKWGEWDAQKADKEVLKQGQKNGETGQLTRSPFIFDDSHKLVVVRDGLRETMTPLRTVIGTDFNSNSKELEVANTISQSAHRNLSEKGSSKLHMRNNNASNDSQGINPSLSNEKTKPRRNHDSSSSITNGMVFNNGNATDKKDNLLIDYFEDSPNDLSPSSETEPAFAKTDLYYSSNSLI